MKNIWLAFLLLLGTTTAAQNYKLEGHELKLNSEVVFETGSARLLAESEPALEAVKAYLLEKKYITLLRVEGHVAADGNENANQTLSERRALAVCKRLVEMGVDCKRLIAVGFGSQKPIADNATPAGKMQNRRISFVNAALMNRAIGGLPADGGGKLAGNVCE